MQLIFSRHFSSTFCWAAQRVGIGICCHTCILSQICNFDTREDAKYYMTGYSIFRIGTEFHPFYLKGFLLCCLNFLRASPSVLGFEFSAGEDDRPFRLGPAPLFPEAIVL